MGQADRTLAFLNRLTKNQGPIEGTLAPGRAAITIEADPANTPQGQLLFSFAVNLLARLHPIIQDLQVVLPQGVPMRVRPPRWASGTLDEHVLLFLRSLNPPMKWSVRKGAAEDRNWTLVVGTASSFPTGSVFIGSGGWEVWFSAHEPTPVGDGCNPIGAYAAASFGVAELCKRFLHPHRELFAGVAIVPTKRSITFSTFTYRIGTSEPNPPLPSHIDLRRLTVVGLGAGGGAATFTLASLPELHGLITLVEPDTILDHNLNRYVFADSEDISLQRLKTAGIQDLFSRFPSLTIQPFPTAYGQVADALRVDDYRYVVAAVHSREARRELQHETPKVFWDAAAAEDGEFRIWRMILGTTECMFCKHPLGEDDPEERKGHQFAQLLGLETEKWRRKLRDNEGFTAEEVAAIANRLDGQIQPFDLPLPGQRLGDWEASQCGRLPLRQEEDEIPIPFAPVMAGVLVAGEIIKEHYFTNAVLDSYYWNTLLGQFMPYNRQFRKLPRSGCCFCGDKDYLDQYGRRWGSRRKSGGS